MNIKTLLFIVSLLSFSLFSCKSSALKPAAIKPAKGNYLTRDSITRGLYTLIFINQDTIFDGIGNDVKKRMEDAFFKVYPQEATDFNVNTIRKVVFLIDPTYHGVAATANDTVHFDPKWMLQQPTDIDVITHEVMHIVQAYGNTDGPGWLTEGIADYARYIYGVDNAGSGWSLPDFNTSQHYDNSYSVTARFLVWIEKRVKPGIVKSMDARMRFNNYTPVSWKTYTGKTLDELWAAYAADPNSI